MTSYEVFIWSGVTSFANLAYVLEIGFARLPLPLFQEFRLEACTQLWHAKVVGASFQRVHAPSHLRKTDSLNMSYGYYLITSRIDTRFFQFIKMH